MAHELTQTGPLDRIFVSKTLPKRNKTEPFVKRVAVRKTVHIYNNVQVKKRAPQSVAKPRLTPNAIRLMGLERNRALRIARLG